MLHSFFFILSENTAFENDHIKNDLDLIGGEGGLLDDRIWQF